MKSKKDQHGPYHFWNYKINQKFTSKSISEDKLQNFRQWIGNRKKLDDIIDMILSYGRSHAIKVLNKKNKNNSK
jgi:hypothetical protein